MTEPLFSDPEPAEPLHPQGEARPSLDPFQAPASFPQQTGTPAPPAAPATPAAR